MKKILALVLTLIMLLVSVSAFAEAAYTYSEFSYDETLFEGIGGEWYGFAEFGVQFYIPDAYAAIEPTEEEAAQGCLMNFANEDRSAVISIAYGVACDLEGNPIENATDLADFYAAAGMTNVDVIVVNGLPVVCFYIPEHDIVSYSLVFADATQCCFSFGPGSDASVATMAGLIMSTLMPLEA
ncbi:MAG: hypothetical protein IKK34_10160 [Clostridia bacterium]|nr:hypothetical protein [Clostridia bacterium]